MVINLYSMVEKAIIDAHIIERAALGVFDKWDELHSEPLSQTKFEEKRLVLKGLLAYYYEFHKN